MVLSTTAPPKEEKRDPGTFCPTCKSDEKIEPKVTRVEDTYRLFQWYCEEIEEHDCDCEFCGFDSTIDKVTCDTPVRWEVHGPNEIFGVFAKGIGNCPGVHTLIDRGRLPPIEAFLSLFPADETLRLV